VDDKENYEQRWPDQPLLQEKKSPSQRGYTECLSVDIPTETPHSSSPPDASEEDD
jgi:hypothetical protein